MDKVLSDSATIEISNKVMDILGAYHISNHHFEPDLQNQNLSVWRTGLSKPRATDYE